VLTDAQILAKYGKPGITSNLTVITLPYSMRIAWDLAHSINKMQCHELVANNFLKVFDDLLAHYGIEKLRELGIDLFGGCYNFRLMRGSKTKWSRHSWGIAIDLDPARNGLKTKWAQAQFSKPEFSFMVETFYKHGFMSYGKERDMDAMHFEINS